MKSVNPSRQRGSASVTALIVCLAGTLGLLGMVAVVQSRVFMVEASEEKAVRRVRLLNGRQLAKELLYTRVLAHGTGTGATVALSDNWGRVTLPAWTSNPYTTDQISAVSNPVCPSPDLEPYVISQTASIYTVVDSSSNWSDPEPFVCNLNAQNTALAGYLLDARRPAGSSSGNSVSDNLLVNGRALVFENTEQNNGFRFEANSVNAPAPCLALSNFSPTIISRPDNFPMLPLPEGVPGGVYVKGDRSCIDAGNTMVSELLRFVQSQGQTIQAETSVDSNGIQADGSGVVNVTVGSFDLTHTIIQGSLTTLNLIGQMNAIEGVAVENLAPVIIITNSTDLTTVNFTNYNRRPFILANTVGEANSALVISYVFPASTDFRMFFIQQDANTHFVLSGPATIRGGLSLDFATSVSGGTLTVEEETNKSFFQLILPRSVWLECYRQL